MGTQRAKSLTGPGADGAGTTRRAVFRSRTGGVTSVRLGCAVAYGPDRLRNRSAEGGEVGRRRNGAAAVAEQDRDVAGAVVGDREVGRRVAVEVSDRDRVGEAVRGEVRRRRKAPAAVAEQDRDVVGALVRDREV